MEFDGSWQEEGGDLPVELKSCSDYLISAFLNDSTEGIGSNVLGEDVMVDSFESINTYE